MTIVVAGGSGFLGQKLAKHLEADGHRVVTLSRRAGHTEGVSSVIPWQPDGSPGDLPRHLDGADAVVNLAGENLADKRWTASRKEALRRSRVLATRTLVRAIATVPFLFFKPFVASFLIGDLVLFCFICGSIPPP